jgi:phage terminase large subunit
MSSLNIQINPTPKQHRAWATYQDKTTTEILFGGGAGGGKSRWLCEVIGSSALRYPGSRWLLGRSVLKTLKQTTLLTLFEVLTAWGLKADRHYVYNQQESTITFFNESVIFLKDLAYYPSDPNYDALGSTEYTGGAIDEANQVQGRAREVVISRFRYRLDDFGLIPTLCMSCNPSKGWAYGEFYKPWRDGTLPPYRAFIPALVTDNPYISQHYIESLKRLKDPALRERLLHGNWDYDDDPIALFDTDALHDLFTNPVRGEGEARYITCDAARLGRDKAVLMVWEGWRVIHITVYDTSLLTQIEAEIERLRRTFDIPRSHVLVDETGVGGGIVDHVPGIKGFVGGAAPIQDKVREVEAQPGYKVNYQNLRAQCFYHLADVVRDHRLACRWPPPSSRRPSSRSWSRSRGGMWRRTAS